MSVVTHGRHCPCSACAREDWTNPELAHCGMHGPSCPPVYAPMTGDPQSAETAPSCALYDPATDTICELPAGHDHRIHDMSGLGNQPVSGPSPEARRPSQSAETALSADTVVTAYLCGDQRRGLTCALFKGHDVDRGPGHVWVSIETLIEAGTVAWLAALPASTESTAVEVADTVDAATGEDIRYVRVSGAAPGGVPAALDVREVADIERNLRVGLDAWYADHASDTGTRFMGADGPFYKVVQATVNRLATIARSASEPAGSAPGCLHHDLAGNPAHVPGCPPAPQSQKHRDSPATTTKTKGSGGT